MVAATAFGIFFIPLFYLAVRRWISRRRPPSPTEIAHHERVEHHERAETHA
jgi:multidrug efflux pump